MTSRSGSLLRVALAALLTFLPVVARAKARASMAVTILGGEVDAVVRVRGASRGGFVVDKVYLGALRPGATLPPASEAARRFLDKGRADGFFLFLERDPARADIGPWALNPMASKPFVTGSACVSLLHWGCERRADHDDVAEAERAIARGLRLRSRLEAARSAAEPEQKLAALRPMFDLEADDFDAHYDLFHAALSALEEVKAADASARPFVDDLLGLPQFQESYSLKEWRNFGAMARERIEATRQSLQR